MNCRLLLQVFCCCFFPQHAHDLYFTNTRMRHLVSVKMNSRGEKLLVKNYSEVVFDARINLVAKKMPDLTMAS